MTDDGDGSYHRRWVGGCSAAILFVTLNSELCIRLKVKRSSGSPPPCVAGAKGAQVERAAKGCARLCGLGLKQAIESATEGNADGRVGSNAHERWVRYHTCTRRCARAA